MDTPHTGTGSAVALRGGRHSLRAGGVAYARRHGPVIRPRMRLTRIRAIRHPEDWDGALPAVLVAKAAGPQERRSLLRRLAAAVLGARACEVEIAHQDGSRPLLIHPAGTGLCLSSAGRDGLAALAVAPGPVGVDIERVDDRAEPPWNVLHPTEAVELRALPVAERPRAFARLWSCKEAYLKALGTGLSREPDSFLVRPFNDVEAVIHEEGEIETRVHTEWVHCSRGEFAVSLVLRAGNEVLQM